MILELNSRATERPGFDGRGPATEVSALARFLGIVLLGSSVVLLVISLSGNKSTHELGFSVLNVFVSRYLSVSNLF